jgi:hypothetical protein
MLYTDKFILFVGKPVKACHIRLLFYFSWALLIQILVCKYLAQLR